GVEIPPLLSRGAGVLPALRRLLFLGRMHAVKAIENLLRAWQRIQQRFPQWELVAAGGDEGDGYLDRIKALSSELKLERISFPGEIQISDRDRVYQSADLYVLPSHTENFGISVAEALANAVPTVVSKNAPWKNLESEKCGWWTSNESNV